MIGRLLVWLLLVVGGLSAAAAAPTPGASEPVRTRAEALIGLLNGRSDPGSLFSKAFLGQIPPAQVKAIAGRLTEQLGPARAVQKVEARSRISGTVFIAFERGTVQFELAVEPDPPHLIQGLLVAGTKVKDDSFARIAEELKRLPGRTSLAVARLGSAAPVMLGMNEPARPTAVGSAFKLFLLAELDRQIRAGERRWTDVVPLTHRSLPSGFLQDWPPGSQLTLQTLATLMISQSDNSAADTLLHLLGRERVEAVLGLVGVQDAQRNRPFLSTMEAFALKGGEPALARAWLAGDEGERRALLGRVAGTGAERIDIARLAARPNLIESVEWFASAEDLVRTMDWLRRNGSRETLDILAVNPGLARAAGGRFGYVGYKGGSETGVIAMAYLVKDEAGGWHALAASWNNPLAKVDEDRFALLLTRALGLLQP